MSWHPVGCSVRPVLLPIDGVETARRAMRLSIVMPERLSHDDRRAAAPELENCARLTFSDSLVEIQKITEIRRVGLAWTRLHEFT